METQAASVLLAPDFKKESQASGLQYQSGNPLSRLWGQYLRKQKKALFAFCTSTLQCGGFHISPHALLLYTHRCE